MSDATATLAAAGCDTPRLDAELLLAFVLGVGRERLVVDAFEELDAADLERFEALVVRREAREPVAYIIGRKPFRRIALSVDRRVLIPRPETELLVEVALSVGRGARVADVGTGSGAVALALKEERPDLSVVGVDVSDAAIEVARENARRLGLDVEFVRADLLDGVPGPFDAVLGEPPLRRRRGPRCPPRSSCTSRRSRCSAGPDGMDLIRRLLTMVGRGAADRARDGSIGRGRRLAGVARRLSVGRDAADLAGLERVVVGRR